MKTAIVLFNLGGPDNQEAVKPFLFNLFSDRAIISLPNPLRWMVAKLISSRRAPVAREIYQQMGGGSPIVPQTQAQARALEAELHDLGDVKAFLAMRYWHPRAEETAAAVKAWAPDQIVLVSLYPQFSTTTTASSLQEWEKVAKNIDLKAKTVKTVCCYPEEPGFVDAVAALTAEKLENCDISNTKVMFSAHGLPKKVIEGGDPYQKQVERSVAAVVKKLNLDGLDHITCYQSRVGPLEWIGPSTEDVVQQAASQGKTIVLVPIAFVSEHSETLVELDIEYRELAEQKGCKDYRRVPTVQANPAFIGGLASEVRRALAGDKAIQCEEDGGCPHNLEG